MNTANLLVNRLDMVTERSVLLQVLNDVQHEPENYKYVVETFIQHLELFGKFLTGKEFATKIEPILIAQDPIVTIIGFSKKLSTIKNHIFRDVMIVLGWLKSVVEVHLQQVICQSLRIPESDEEQIQNYREFAAACVNLSDKISNFRAIATSNDHLKYINTVIWVIKNNIVCGMQKALIEAHDKLSNANIRTLAEFLSTGRNMVVENESLLTKIVEFVEELPKPDKKWKNMMRNLFLTPTEQGTRVHENLLTALFLTAKNEKLLQRCVGSSSIKTSAILRRVVLVKLPFQRILEPWNIKVLVDFAHKNDEEHVFSLLETAIKIWSDSNYTKKCPEPQEKHIVRLIVYCIHKVKKNLTLSWSEFFLTATQGVHTRMAMMPTFIRSALFLNSTLAKLAHSATKNSGFVAPQDMKPPENEDFELNIAANEWNEEMKEILKKGILQTKPTPTEKVENSSEVDASRIVASAFENPQKPPQPSPSFWKPNKVDSDDDEDFPSYEVEEVEKNFENLKVGEEPKKAITPPAYIVDAFEMLLEKEKYEVFEAAFFRLPYLISRKSVGFTQIADKIVIRCLHLQNTFGTRNFDENVEEIIIGCITNRPEIVPDLLRLFITCGQGDRIQQRLLHFIHKSAEELGNSHRRNTEFIEKQQKVLDDQLIREKYTESGEKVRPRENKDELLISYNRSLLHRLKEDVAELFQNYILAVHPYREPRDDEDDYEDEEEEYPEWRRVVDARIAAKTRIISARRREKPTTSINRLGQIPQYMFYPLLIPPRGDNARLLNQDSELLSLIIMVASMVFVRSGVSPTIISMSKELLAYVAPHRFSENTKVRAACLSAYLNVIALLPMELIVQIFDLETRRSWLEYAEASVSMNVGNQLEFEMAHQLAVHMYAHLAQLDDK